MFSKNSVFLHPRYDVWAGLYDSDVGSYEDYLVPTEAVRVAKKSLIRMIEFLMPEREPVLLDKRCMMQVSKSCGSFDVVITCGTTSQMPSYSLREFVRLIRPGGHIIFAVMTDPWESCGYAEIYNELNAAGKIDIQSRGEPFQMMPTTEPDFYCEIWTMRIS